ncbi:hypothetical protein KCU73_g852, partial [Aureobasidium melanogenum]
MTAAIHIDGLTLRLKTDSSLSPVVEHQPVVAVFEDPTTKENDLLGQVSARNTCSDILRLSINVDEQTSKLFIALSIWIPTKRSRNKNNKQPRLMILVVPAETLTLESDCCNYNELVDQLPGIVSERPSDDKSGACKLLRVTFNIGPAKSYVIMPHYKRQVNVMEQQMTLLRKLRSLSESSRFQLFTNYDKKTFAAIGNLCKIQPGTVATPAVNLEQLYSSKQSGCIGMWKEHGLRAQCSVKERMVAACKDAEPPDEPHSALGPPRYEPRAPGFEKPSSSGNENPAPCPAGLALTGHHSSLTSFQLPSTAPPYSTHAELSSALHDTTWQHASVAAPESRSSTNLVTMTRHYHASTPVTPPSKTSTMEVPTSSHNYLATFLSGFSGYTNVASVMSVGCDRSPSSMECSVQERNCGLARATREDSFACVQVPATDPGNPAPIFASTSSYTTSQIPDSPTRKRRLSRSFNDETVRPAIRQFSTSPSICHDYETGFSPTVADSLSYHDVHARSGRVTADHDLCPVGQKVSFLSLWLLEAWEYCPDAHHVLQLELLSLATAINHSTRDEDITTDLGDLQRRLGLRGAILRGGEPWRTVEIRHFMHDVKAFYQGYEQYLCRKEPYPDTFDTDIDTMLDAHGPVLWPGGPRDQTRQPWLFLANDHPAYQHDLYYSLHRDNKIRPLFSSLLHKQVAVYHGNQKTMKQKEVKVEVEEGEVAATTTSSPAWPRSLLTNADTAADEPWSPDRNVRRVQSLAGAAEPRKMTVDQEFSLRKRKRGDDSPIIRASKSSGTSVAAPSPTRDDKVITTKNQNKMMKRQSTDDVVSLSQVSTAALHHRVSLCLTSNDFRWVIKDLPVVTLFSQAVRKQLEDLGHFPVGMAWYMTGPVALKTSSAAN